jgi:hypothetical protein
LQPPKYRYMYCRSGSICWWCCRRWWWWWWRRRQQ